MSHVQTKPSVIAYSKIKRAIADYPEPTFREMLRICQDFGLITDVDASVRGIRMQCVNQTFDVSVDEAEVLMQGLLLGFFYGHSRDDLSLAQWEQ